MRISNKWYVCDFETTGENFYEQFGYTKVWLYAICDNDAQIVSYGDSIEGFIEFLKHNTGKTYYFHNLKFDGSFILNYLLRNGYQYANECKTPFTFTTLIGDLGQWYIIEIMFTKGRRVKIVDSLKLLPFKVEQIANDFDLPVKKGKIDYDDYTIDDERLEYVFNDVKIVALALKEIKAEGMTKLTTAACAYAQYESFYSQDQLNFNDPKLSSEFLTEWREAYRGGRSQVNPFYAGKLLEGVYRYDINSMYPYVMYTKPMPIGEPIPITKRGDYLFELYHLKIAFSLKPNHLPCILKKGSLFYGDDSYYVDTDEIIDLWISNIDYQLLVRHYDIQFETFVSGYGFYTSTNLFKGYIDKWYEKKKKSKGAKRIVAKLMLNSLYGKFGSNHIGKKKIPILNNEVLKFNESKEEEMRHYYLPRAIAITSWAHMVLDDGIQDVGVENFVYCDTDSIHSMVKMSDSMVDSSKLGYYKLEAQETRSKYIRQKTYIYETDDEGIRIVCAGMSENIKSSFVNEKGEDAFILFEKGLKIEGKLLPKQVEGGTILYATTFEIKA